MCVMLTGHQVIVDVMIYVQFINLLEAVLDPGQGNSGAPVLMCVAAGRDRFYPELAQF